MLSWEKTRCDWCGSSEGEVLFEGPDLLMDLPGQFRMVRCKTCGLVRQDPRLTWECLKDYYPADYSAYEPIIDQEPSRLRRTDRRYGMWKRLRTIEQFQPGGKLLDIGCGTGVFLAEAKRSGRWELMGIEPSRSAAIYVQDVLQIPILNQRFSEVKISPSQFDVITMWNVLEHLEQPITDLRHAYPLLKDGGWFVFSIPNLESLEARIFGQYWLGWDLPRHLYLFPQSLLKNILNEIGFRYVDRHCIAGSHAALELSLLFLMKGTKIDNPLADLALRVYKSFPARVLLSPPFWILDQLNLCSLITIFAQKKSTS